MGFSCAACAVSGLPISSDALGLLVARRANGPWEPFSAPAPVSLDEYQNFTAVEDDRVLLVLATLFPEERNLQDQLRDHRVGASPMRLPSLDLAFALVEPSIAEAVTSEAFSRLPRRTDALLPLAFSQAGVQVANADEPAEALRFCAALRLLALPLEPFGSFGDVVPGRDFAEVRPAFDRAAQRLSTHPGLASAIELLRRFWETGDDDGESDEGVDEGEALRFTRTFTGVWTVRVARASAGPLAEAVEALTRWQRLEIVTTVDPAAPSALIQELGPTHRLTITEVARAALVQALRSGRDWGSDEGEVVVQVR